MRARPRAALLEAAGQIIAEEGYDQLSMDKVAARAGMTKGAIYGNFASEEDLIAEALTAGVRRPPPALKAGGSLAEQLQIIANDLIAQGSELRGLAIKLVAFQLYALTHEDMRQRVAKENTRIHARIEAWTRQMLPVDQLAMSPEHFVGILHALSNGRGCGTGPSALLRRARPSRPRDSRGHRRSEDSSGAAQTAPRHSPGGRQTPDLSRCVEGDVSSRVVPERPLIVDAAPAPPISRASDRRGRRPSLAVRREPAARPASRISPAASKSPGVSHDRFRSQLAPGSEEKGMAEGPAASRDGSL